MSRGRALPGRLLPTCMAAILATTLAAPATPAPTVDEIVARYVTACGGLKRIRSVQTLRQKGRITTGANRQAVVTRELKRPNRTRFTFTLQGVTEVFVSDGQRGWRMAPLEGDVAPSPLTDDVVQEAAEQGDIEGPLVDWQAKGHQLELVGREVVGDREAYKLKLTLKSGAVRYEYLDVKSLHRLRTDTTREVRGRPVELQISFGNYKKSGGMLFPHLIEVAAIGRPQHLSIMVDSVEINPPLSDALFETTALTTP